jgi:hypothetical protein
MRTYIRTERPSAPKGLKDAAQGFNSGLIVGKGRALRVRRSSGMRDEHPVAATVHEAKWCAQPNRCLEATDVPRLNAQSPSKLGWRLRVKSRHICGFDSLMDLKHTISLMDSRRYRSAYWRSAELSRRSRRSL